MIINSTDGFLKMGLVLKDTAEEKHLLAVHHFVQGIRSVVVKLKGHTVPLQYSNSS